MSDSLSNSTLSKDSRSSLTKSVSSFTLSTSESITNAPKVPDSFQYTDDQFIFTSQSSGDNRHSLQHSIKYPKESELSNVVLTELSKVDQNLEIENICALCMPDEICRCTVKLDINRFMKIQKPDASKIKHYIDFSPDNIRSKKSHLKSPKDKSLKSQIPSKTNNESCVSFWFRFFGLTLFFTILVTYLSQFSEYIIWNKLKIIPTLLSGGIFIIGCCWLFLMNFCHRPDYGYQFSKFDYIMAICSIMFLGIPWIIFSFNLKFQFIYISLIILTTSITIYGKLKETMSNFQRFIRKCLFVLHIVVCFLSPVIHYSYNQEHNPMIFSFGAWLSIFVSIYGVAMLLNKFFSHSYIYVEMTSQIVVYEVLQVYQVVYLAFSTIQYVNMIQLMKLKSDSI